MSSKRDRRKRRRQRGHNEARERQHRKVVKLKGDAGRLLGSMRSMEKWQVPDLTKRMTVMPHWEGWRTTIAQARMLSESRVLPHRLRATLAKQADACEETIDVFEAAYMLAEDDAAVLKVGKTKDSGKSKRAPIFDIKVDEMGDLVPNVSAAMKEFAESVRRRLLTAPGVAMATFGTPYRPGDLMERLLKGSK